MDDQCGKDLQDIADDAISDVSVDYCVDREQDLDVEAVVPMMKRIVQETCHFMVPAAGYPSPGKFTPIDPKIYEWITEIIAHCTNKNQRLSRRKQEIEKECTINHSIRTVGNNYT